MNDPLTTLLTLIIMIIGLALIIGGLRGVRFVFAPFVVVLRGAIQALFVALILLLIASAVLRGGQSRSTQEPASAPVSQDAESTHKQKETRRYNR